MYKTLQIKGWTTYQLVQDFSHQQYHTKHKYRILILKYHSTCQKNKNSFFKLQQILQGGWFSQQVAEK